MALTSPAGGEGGLGWPPFRHDVHSRGFRDHRHVYAVLSRRVRGLSIGINLSPERSCNFDCVYCQVDRSVDPVVAHVDEDRLLTELEAMLRLAASGDLVRAAASDGVPPASRRVADVAFSGDGEPTSYPGWGALVERVGATIERFVPKLPMTLITNASLFHRPAVRDGLAALAARNGRVWAKLDAGTDGYFGRIARTEVPFARIVDNIREEARQRPLVIQSLFLRLGEETPPRTEIDAYAAQIAAIVERGGRLSGVHVMTLARPPAVREARPVDRELLERIAARVRQAAPSVPVEVFGPERVARGGIEEGAW